MNLFEFYKTQKQIDLKAAKFAARDCINAGIEQGTPRFLITNENKEYVCGIEEIMRIKTNGQYFCPLRKPNQKCNFSNEEAYYRYMIRKGNTIADLTKITIPE